MPLATFCSINLSGTRRFRMSLYADQGIARTFNIIDLLPHVGSFHFGISNKAVADGAVSYSIDHLVKTRVAKFTYGVNYSIAFDCKQSDHLSREHTKSRRPDGIWYLPTAFWSMLKKVLLPCDFIMIYKA